MANKGVSHIQENKHKLTTNIMNNEMLYYVWIVRLYYFGFLVNEGIGLTLVIQTFYPSYFNVFLITMST